ncbi:MAG: hypothetical protein GXP60_06560 [Epsilonproteobacteria bacterium]|nr:hypothetical protein [Campylobacterota bacterium]
MRSEHKYIRSIEINGLDRTTITSYIERIINSIENNMSDADDLRYIIKNIESRKLGALLLPSFKIEFCGQKETVEETFRQFRKMIFRGGG